MQIGKRVCVCVCKYECAMLRCYTEHLRCELCEHQVSMHLWCNKNHFYCPFYSFAVRVVYTHTFAPTHSERGFGLVTRSMKYYHPFPRKCALNMNLKFCTLVDVVVVVVNVVGTITATMIGIGTQAHFIDDTELSGDESA